MPASPDRQFSLPTRRRAPWWLWAGALAVHVPLVLLLIRISHRVVALPVDDLDTRRTVALAPAVDMRAPRAFQPLPHPALPAAPSRRATAAPQAATTQVPLTVPRVLPPPAQTPITIARAPSDTPPRAPTGITTPQYGNGTLWLQPLPLAPREMAERLTGKTAAQSADSQVTALVQQWLDRMAEEKAQRGPALPSWTTTIAGKKVGLDSKWVYLGPIKIPSALLGLLPIMQTGNPTQAEFAKRLNQMRDDLFDAARRAANYDDFRQAVKDMRQQKENEAQFKKNQRTKPDSVRGG